MVSSHFKKIHEFRSRLRISLSIVYPSNKILCVATQYGKWSAHQGASFEIVSSHPWKNMIFSLISLASVFRLFTHRTRYFVSSFNMENDQRIKAHLLAWLPAILKKYMIFGLVFLDAVFRLFTHRTRYLVSSVNMENDQRIKAHLLIWFPAMFEKCRFSASVL